MEPGAELAAARRPRLSGPARFVLWLFALEVLVYLVTTFPGVRAEGFLPLRDGWLQGAGYVAAAVLAILRATSSPVDRVIWTWLAAAVTARAAGFVLFLAVVRRQQPPPYPSVADAAWLAMYLLMLAGLVELARRRACRLSALLGDQSAGSALPRPGGRSPGGIGAAPGALELELTEDLFMADPARARTAISRLLEAAVSLVIDDYGTGFSSLGYLRDLRDLRGLKLDRSFVTHMDDDRRAGAIVESTIGLAHSLGMHVIAEGVETTAVRDRLLALGCELGQGFLFSPPMPADQLVFDASRAEQPPPS